MVGRYAQVKDGQVVNIALADPDFALKMGWIPSNGAKIGDTWDGSRFISPQPKPEPTPAKEKVDVLASALIKKGLITEKDLERI